MNSIEIIGIPGSGKSTNYKKIVKQYRDKGLKVITIEEVICKYMSEKFKWLKLLNFHQKFLFIISDFLYKLRRFQYVSLIELLTKNQEFMYKIFQINTKRTIYEKEKQYVMNLLFETLIIYNIANNVLDSDEYLLIDEGYVQKLITIFVSDTIDIDIDILEDIIFYFGKPYALVCLDVDIEESYSRLEKRNFTNRLKTKNKSEKMVCLQGMYNMYTNVIEICQKNDIEIVKYGNPN